jgi:iron complex outermembrane receptor protein
VNISYTLKSEKLKFESLKFFKEAVVGLSLNNVFNRHYVAGGWVYSAILSGSHPNDNRYYQIGYMPSAGFTMMGNITLRF